MSPVISLKSFLELSREEWVTFFPGYFSSSSSIKWMAFPLVFVFEVTSYIIETIKRSFPLGILLWALFATCIFFKKPFLKSLKRKNYLFPRMFFFKLIDKMNGFLPPVFFELLIRTKNDFSRGFFKLIDKMNDFLLREFFSEAIF